MCNMSQKKKQEVPIHDAQPPPVPGTLFYGCFGSDGKSEVIRSNFPSFAGCPVSHPLCGYSGAQGQVIPQDVRMG